MSRLYINFKLDKSTCSCLFSKNWFNHDGFWAIADWIKIHLLLILVVEMLKNEINIFFSLFKIATDHDYTITYRHTSTKKDQATSPSRDLSRASQL